MFVLNRLSSPTKLGLRTSLATRRRPTGVFGHARPGEVGDRNVLRAPSYISLDRGLYKTFNLPWEGQTLQFRWEVFNVTNTQRFEGLTIADLSLGRDPFLGGNPNSDFGRFTSRRPRSMKQRRDA